MANQLKMAVESPFAPAASRVRMCEMRTRDREASHDQAFVGTVTVSVDPFLTRLHAHPAADRHPLHDTVGESGCGQAAVARRGGHSAQARRGLQRFGQRLVKGHADLDVEPATDEGQAKFLAVLLG